MTDLNDFDNLMRELNAVKDKALIDKALLIICNEIKELKLDHANLYTELAEHREIEHSEDFPRSFSC